MRNEYSLVTYVPPTLFDLYRVIIREVHGEALNTTNSVKDVQVCGLMMTL
jgi:hypothetical protein